MSNMKKETVRLLFAPKWWICLELLNLLLAQTGMTYPYLTEIGKGYCQGRSLHRLLRSSPQPDTLTYEGETFLEMRLSPKKRQWRWGRESAKPLYASYENCNRDVPIINVDGIICETIKHVNKEHIEAFYRTTNEKFAIASKEVELKGECKICFRYVILLHFQLIYM